MSYHNLHNDIITAIATPSGSSALGIIRLSGDGCVSLVNAIFKGKDITKAFSHTLHYGFIMDEDEMIDEVMISIYEPKKSFTTQESIEITCHGSAYILHRILFLLLKKGARMAEAGEFTQRAFLNGRIDLTQAEAIADLIASETQSQHEMAMKQMRGGVSKEINYLRQELIDFAALLELELDFSEEDVEFANRGKLSQLITDILEKIGNLNQTFKYGNAIKKGIPVVIAGKPNAGKSTLLNVLLNEDRAIVSHIAGTTRDVIEEVIIWDGIPYRLIDTAGLREAGDEIEKIGIEKTYSKINESAILLYIFDTSANQNEDIYNEIKALNSPKTQIILVGNKVEAISEKDKKQWEDSLAEFTNGIANLVFISAKENYQIKELIDTLMEVAKTQIPKQGSTVISNMRHYKALEDTKEILQNVLPKIEFKEPTEIISFDIREALGYLGSISGEIDSEDVLDSVFSRFCIGK